MKKEQLLIFIICLVSAHGYSVINNISGVTGPKNSIYYIAGPTTVWAGAQIKDESIYLFNRGYLKGDLVIDNSSIFAYDPPGGKFISYSTTNGNDGTSNNRLNLINGSSLIIKFTRSRKNIAIKELSGNSSISRIGTGGDGLYVYTGKNSIIKNCRFQNIKNIECITPFAEFSNVDLINTEIGMLNWQAGRVDRYRINIPTTQSGWFSWMGKGSDRNQIWDWNPQAINPSKIVHQLASSRYFYGYTATYQFMDKESLKPVPGVKVYYRDNKLDPAKFELIGEYFSGASGRLNGKYNTRLRTNTLVTAFRPTIFFLTKYSLLTGGTQLTGIGNPYNSYRYKVQDVSITLDVRSYGHEYIDKKYSINSELGRIDSKTTPLEYQNYYLTPDKYITQKDVNIVKNYTEIFTTAQLYDYLKYMWVHDEKVPYVGVEASKLTFPDGWSLRLNKSLTGAEPVRIDYAKKRIAVRCKNLKPSENITLVQAPTGIISFKSNREYISMPYIDMNSNSYVLVEDVDDTDWVLVKDGDNVLYNRYGEFGFTYRAQNKNYQMYIHKADGTVARKNFDLNQPGIYNKFSISYSKAHDDFTEEDRKVLKKLPDNLIKKAEANTSLLNELKAWMILFTKQNQEQPQ